MAGQKKNWGRKSAGPLFRPPLASGDNVQTIYNSTYHPIATPCNFLTILRQIFFFFFFIMAVRASPRVQRTQESSPWIDIYTDSATSPLRERSITQHLRPVTPHAHPEPQRLQDPGGWGARYMNDKAPCTLWDKIIRAYRAPTRNEFEWI